VTEQFQVLCIMIRSADSDSHLLHNSTYNYPHLAVQARTVRIVPGLRPDEAAWTRYTADDITSGLPDDITGSWLTLTMGHGQTVTSGLHGDVTKWCITSGLPTDSAIITTDLAAEC